MFAQQTTGSSAQPSPHHVKGLAGKGEGSKLVPLTQLTHKEPPIPLREL